jgi:hypothetical protein
MGYTQHTIDLVEEIIIKFRPTSVIDLGAQNNYSEAIPANGKAPYMLEWYLKKGIRYVAIDLCKENGSIPVDLKYPLDHPSNMNLVPQDWKCDLLVDAGTSEHVSGEAGGHDIKAFYNCWKTKHDLVKPGGIILSENPKTGNWPGHGCNYIDMRFYQILAQLQGYEILHLVENAAMGNVTDGYNITCMLRKVDDKPFISLEDFIKCDVKTS